ncbi:unnamed protein product [Orchesella dallaii]|uniref:BTB domain-containing protein n=1 Tax=Orchesella dallaii TaxID=48710 RepID=A0ABP1RWQ0_9HEXA
MSIPFVINRDFEFLLKRERHPVTRIATLNGRIELRVYNDSIEMPEAGPPLYDLFYAQSEMRRRIFLESVIQQRHAGDGDHVNISYVFPTRQSNTVEVTVEGDYLANLAAQYNRPMRMSLNTTVRNLHLPPRHLQVITGEAYVLPDGRCIIQGEAPHNISINRKFGRYWRVAATIELRLMPGDNMLFRYPVDNRVCLRRMLEEKLHCDFVLTPANRVPILCHKSVLASVSPFFNAIFAVNLQEVRDNACNMNFSEESVKAMLKFCYYSDLEGPMWSPYIALELLEIGHLYGIQLLEETMLDIFIGKSYGWYSIDVAVYIYFKTWQINTLVYQNLRTAVVDIIKMLHNELPGSEQFIYIQRNFPLMARQLMEQL